MKLYCLSTVLRSVALLAAVLFMSCQQNSVQKETQKAAPCLSEREKESMNPQSVQAKKVVRKLRLNGRIAYDPQAVVNFVSLVGGTVSQTYFALGDKVKKGQILADIKSAELNLLQAQEKQLRTKLKVVKRELATTKGFYEDKVSSEKDLIKAKSKKENLEAKLNALRQNLDLYSSKSDENIFQIKAPRSGVVVKNRLVPGLRFGAESQPLFMISDLEHVWVKLNIYATEIGVIKEGMIVNVESNSYPGQVFSAEINHVSAIIDEEENVLKAWATLDNVDGFLKPGLYIEGNVDIKDDRKALRVPIGALVFKNDRYYVVVLQDCHPKTQEVDVLYQDEDYGYIDKGLKEGQTIATKNALRHLYHSAIE